MRNYIVARIKNHNKITVTDNSINALVILLTYFLQEIDV